jgi:hypothetical protein
LQKLANAAEKAFAERALLLDENRLLFEQNNESNCCQSTRSTVVGKAKMMILRALWRHKGSVMRKKLSL